MELTLRWLLEQPAVGAVLLGSSTLDHLRPTSPQPGGSRLDPDLVAACDDVWRRLRGPAPSYNR